MNTILLEGKLGRMICLKIKLTDKDLDGSLPLELTRFDYHLIATQGPERVVLLIGLN